MHVVFRSSLSIDQTKMCHLRMERFGKADLGKVTKKGGCNLYWIQWTDGHLELWPYKSLFISLEPPPGTFAVSLDVVISGQNCYFTCTSLAGDVVLTKVIPRKYAFGIGFVVIKVELAQKKNTFAECISLVSPEGEHIRCGRDIGRIWWSDETP